MALCFWFFFLAVLGFELRASPLLGRHLPLQPCLQPRVTLRRVAEDGLTKKIIHERKGSLQVGQWNSMYKYPEVVIACHIGGNTTRPGFLDHSQ
jgi:hypothetical protein